MLLSEERTNTSLRPQRVKERRDYAKLDNGIRDPTPPPLPSAPPEPTSPQDPYDNPKDRDYVNREDSDEDEQVGAIFDEDGNELVENAEGSVAEVRLRSLGEGLCS